MIKKTSAFAWCSTAFALIFMVCGCLGGAGDSASSSLSSSQLPLLITFDFHMDLFDQRDSVEARRQS
jgi:hypothetical protein